ncbi:hypothetical protein BHE74_00058075 [Ensete ventricosum]|uniref:Uncharacterized protein n=1 Tax=Ensete ventricosum TaxID=4639 RepID=A0A426XYT4_ENSVE|nr:hypothetical protein B296_00047252 [Ensete ventricosum]RWW36870.1 hypothetical protein BHE74_00058075 [Ensete ventricosum]
MMGSRDTVAPSRPSVDTVIGLLPPLDKIYLAHPYLRHPPMYRDVLARRPPQRGCRVAGPHATPRGNSTRIGADPSAPIKNDILSR